MEELLQKESYNCKSILGLKLKCNNISGFKY
jgi:hypothetical protein